MIRLLLAFTLGLAPAASAIALLPGMGAVHHKIQTSNREAQKFFDQGLALIYAFNFDAAAESFRRAAELDPRCALCQWGIALAVGPNYNDAQIDAKRMQLALGAAKKAVELSQRGPAEESALALALASRFSQDPEPDRAKLAAAYRDAMRDVSRRFPKDSDAAVLFAGAAMDVRPWRLWEKGRAAPGTEEILAVLREVLAKEPNHVGANHYFIHAIEASPHPEEGLVEAERLPALAPSASHLVHMPAHIYMRTGDYEAAVKANEHAVLADRIYIRDYNPMGEYRFMYYPHNTQFLAVVASFAGRNREALEALTETENAVRGHVAAMPMLDFFMASRPLLLVKLHRWAEIFHLPESTGPLSETALHFARAMAFAYTGKADEASDELHQMQRSLLAVPPDLPFGQNSAEAVFAVGMHLVEAQLLRAQHDPEAAKQAFRAAERAEDALNYDEPPDWIQPVRESFGAYLLERNELPQAAIVFSEELARHPKSGRALFGLLQAYRRQGKEEDVRRTEELFKDAWTIADGPLTIEDLQ